MLVINPDDYIEQEEDISSEHDKRKRGVCIFFYIILNKFTFKRCL